MLSTRLSLALLPLMCALTSLAAGGDSTPLEVDAMAPAGTLRDAQGAPVALSSLYQDQPVVLIFYRGGWCPYCSRQLTGLVEIEDALQEAGYRLVAISPDRPAKLRAKPELEGLAYTLLSDSSMEVSRGFGIAFQVEDALVEKYKNSYGIDLEGDSGETHHLLPHPSVFLLGQDGKIDFAHVDPDYKVRLDPAKILAAARGH